MISVCQGALLELPGALALRRASKKKLAFLAVLTRFGRLPLARPACVLPSSSKDPHTTGPVWRRLSQAGRGRGDMAALLLLLAALGADIPNVRRAAL